MIIKQVILTNIKCHSNLQAEFTPGVNAIVGPNGSGKSTILEAIGYCLFGSLSYKVNQFLKNGEKQGQIIVDIEHNNQTYSYVRDVGGREGQWYVHNNDDIEATGAEDVPRFTKNLLGLSEDADLSSIFEDAIGVQQGLLTAPFLLSKTKRHAIFQPLFDIDIYRKCFEALRPVEAICERVISENTIIINSNSADLEIFKKSVAQTDERNKRISELFTPVPGYEENIKHLDSSIECITAALRAKNDVQTLSFSITTLKGKIEHIDEKLGSLSGKKDELLKLTPHVTNRSKWNSHDNTMKQLLTRKESVKQRIHEVESSIKSNEMTIKQYDLSKMKEVKEVASKLQEREEALAKCRDDRVKAEEKHQTHLNVLNQSEKGVCPLLGVECTPLSCYTPEARANANKANETIKVATRAEKDAEALVKESKEAQKTFHRLENDLAMKQAVERELKKNQGSLVDANDILREVEKDYTAAKKKRDALTFDETLYAKGVALQRELEDEWNEVELRTERLEHTTVLQKYEEERDRLSVIASDVTSKDLDDKLEEREMINNLLQPIRGAINELKKQQPSDSQYDDWKEKIEIIVKKTADLTELKDKEELCLGLIQDLRSIYNSLGPEIMELLLDTINSEANDYFTALTGSPDLLYWDRDFEASLRNAEGKRVFTQLSGGQQMIVAIALRLAVLKHLGNLPIVFLDEPTANLDEERRQVLASVVGNIMGFTQVFVISHGDEFSSEVDNVIQLPGN
jgi:exonuclease SbcC